MPVKAAPKARKKTGKTATSPPPAPKPSGPKLNDPRLYMNREMSLLAFQRRVLEEAQDRQNPLLERVKFLAILASNLDEFFMVRVAGVIAQDESGVDKCGADGLKPPEILSAARTEVEALLQEAHECLGKRLLPALAKHGVEVLDYSELSARQREVAEKYFASTIFPVLTPLAFDPGRPFPHISNLSLNLAVLIEAPGKGEESFARVKVPDSLPQLVPVGGNNHGSHEAFVWIEQVIAANIAALFHGMEVREVHPFHITRDADLAIKELEADDLLETIEEGVRARRFGSVVRLEADAAMPESMLQILTNNLELEPSQVYRSPGLLSLSRLMQLYKLNRPDLKDAVFVPAMPKGLVRSSEEQAEEEEDIFSVLRRKDVLLHHPYDSFQPVVDFLKQAAHDPKVQAIKMVLYRVGRNSPVVEALLEAMNNDKQVAVLVELKARFDEESNIEWARALEREGVHVAYGLVGLKTHCKLLQVVRNDGDAVRRYVHAATGNYNAVTAHLYTDLGLLTCRPEFGEDSTDLFNYLTGYSAKRDYRKLLVSPVNLRDRFEALIRREIEHARKGAGGRLIFKMNALEDARMIRLLYEASQAGVKISLLVRGICCLRPGVSGVSENIEVTSIVGRFLEHSRIYYFANGGKEEVYLGSADLMPRNLDRRVEVLFPLEDQTLVRYVKDEALRVYLDDTAKARIMQSDGTYVRRSSGGKKPLNSQKWFLEQSRAQAKSSPTA
jgi:polyphosphate kinase